MTSAKSTNNKRPDPNPNDPVDEYFECEAQCSVNDSQCHDECVEQLKDNGPDHSWPSTLYLTTEHFGPYEPSFVMTEAEMLKAIHKLNTADPSGQPLTLDHCDRLEFVRARADNTEALYQSTSENWGPDGLWLKIENPALTCWPSGGVGPDVVHFYDPEVPEDVENFEA